MTGALEQGRESYRRRAWAKAWRALARADKDVPLDHDDLERLATSAYLIGRERDFQQISERIHHSHLDAGDPVRAARWAFWLGLSLLFRGEAGSATGWFARARRLIDEFDCVEHGYLLLPIAEQQLGNGDCDAAHAGASRAAEIGERFNEPDLIAAARHLQGRARICQGDVCAGLELLDEAMLAVVHGELSPIITGLIYCSVIDACLAVHAMPRAREWTAALTRWCDQQPELIAFTGTCRVHRAEILRFHGAWPDALAEAIRAAKRVADNSEALPPAEAYYQQAETHRLRGDFVAADHAYRTAHKLGYEPQPGLALLRMMQGRLVTACAAIRRVLSATSGPLARSRLLPAHIEITLVAGELEEARGSCRELETIAQRFDVDVLSAWSTHTRGALALAEGDPRTAHAMLRRAAEIWRRLEAPYETARVCVLTGLACRALSDHEGAELEFAAARTVFEKLGAAADLARLDAQVQGGSRTDLTPREQQVLRLLAAGKTNKTIAAELSLSERTIDRHVSNIYDKLDVSSRAAATAYAYDHDLI